MCEESRRASKVGGGARLVPTALYASRAIPSGVKSERKDCDGPPEALSSYQT